MKVKLKEVAKIYAGYPFRSKVLVSETGSYIAVQPKDVQPNGIIKYSNNKLNPIPEPKPVHILKQGDILFLSKLSPKAIYIEQPKSNAVPSTSFLIIRPDLNKLYPRFLVWYLNQPFAQKILKKSAQGSSIINIPKKILINIELDLPELKTQKIIAELYQLSLNYTVKHEELQMKIKKLTNQLALKILVQ